jgi:hypothetical protein
MRSSRPARTASLSSAQRGRVSSPQPAAVAFRVLAPFWRQGGSSAWRGGRPRVRRSSPCLGATARRARTGLARASPATCTTTRVDAFSIAILGEAFRRVWTVATAMCESLFASVPCPRIGLRDERHRLGHRPAQIVSPTSPSGCGASRATCSPLAASSSISPPARDRGTRRLPAVFLIFKEAFSMCATQVLGDRDRHVHRRGGRAARQRRRSWVRCQQRHDGHGLASLQQRARTLEAPSTSCRVRSTPHLRIPHRRPR